MLQALLGFVGPESNDSQSKAAGTNGSFRKKRFRDRSLLRFGHVFWAFFWEATGLGSLAPAPSVLHPQGPSYLPPAPSDTDSDSSVWLLLFFNPAGGFPGLGFGGPARTTWKQICYGWEMNLLIWKWTELRISNIRFASICHEIGMQIYIFPRGTDWCKLPYLCFLYKCLCSFAKFVNLWIPKHDTWPFYCKHFGAKKRQIWPKGAARSRLEIWELLG